MNVQQSLPYSSRYTVNGVDLCYLSLESLQKLYLDMLTSKAAEEIQDTSRWKLENAVGQMIDTLHSGGDIGT